MTKKSEELEAPGKTAMSVLAPGSGVKEYEEANNLIQRQSLDAAIDLALVRQGIDPQRVSKKDFDIIRRLNIKLNAINIKAQQEMSRIQQAAGNEYNGTILELNQVCMNLKVIQGVVPEPPAGVIETSATELPEATPAAPAESAAPVQETVPAQPQ